MQSPEMVSKDALQWYRSVHAATKKVRRIVILARDGER